MTKKLHSILTIISYLIIVITVSGLIVGFVNSRVYNNRKGIALFDYTPMIVVSGSMLPTIDVDAFVVMKYCDISDVNEGDIITYKFGSMSITHRVIDKVNVNDNITLKTQGDNNEHPDSIAITKDNFIGKVVLICNPAAKILKYVINKDLTLNRFKVLVLWIFVVGILWSISELYYILLNFINIFRYTLSKIKNKELELNNHENNRIVEIDYFGLIRGYNNNELNRLKMVILASLIVLVDSKQILKDMRKHKNN